MKLALAAIVLMAGAAEAATVAVWRGAGPNACHGACSLDWALEQLTEAQRGEVLAAMEAGGAKPILVHRGDVFEFMSYQRGGMPYVDRRRTVAGMDEPARAWGWRLEGWSFVQLEECGNWAPVVHEERAVTPVAPSSPVAAPEPAIPVLAGAPPLFVTLPGGSVSRADPIFLTPPATPPQTATPPPIWEDLTDPPPSPPTSAPDPGPDPLPPTSPPPVAVVPTPQGAALLVLALGLVWARFRPRPA